MGIYSSSSTSLPLPLFCFFFFDLQTTNHTRSYTFSFLDSRISLHFHQHIQRSTYSRHHSYDQHTPHLDIATIITPV